MNKQKNEKLLKNKSLRYQINPIRTNTHVQNRAKINFAYKNQPHDKQKYNDLINSNQEIDAWETAFNKEDNQIGMIRFKLKQKITKKREKNIYFINRASLTTKSWNAQRERLNNLRKQLPMANPKFQPQDSTFFKHQNNILGYFKRKKEQEFQNKNHEQSQNIINFNKHRNLLSRIYSHSVEPKILIRGYSPPQQYNSNIPITPQKNINSSLSRRKQISTNSRKRYKIFHNFQMTAIHKNRQKQVFNHLSNQKRLQIKFKNNSQVKNQLKIIS